MAGTASRLIALTGVVVVVFLGSLSVGAADVPLAEVVRTLTGGGSEASRTLILELRLPRALLALLVGGGLAISGAVFQAVLRNPLAEPYILGVSGGAAVGAVLAVVLGLASVTIWAVPGASFVGGLVAIFVVLGIATAAGSALSPRVLILAGVVVGAFFNAIILLMLALADAESFRSAIFWMMGSLSGASWTQVGIVATYGIPAMIVLVLCARPLNLLAIDEQSAFHLGVSVQRLRRVIYLVTSLLVAATVAVSGVIGFVGLVIPHALRLGWGADHRLVLPGSVLAGGAFLLATDTLARTVVAPGELPTGVLTAIVGVPFFVALLIKGDV
jgi:iron complex transport system permease protein